MTIDINMQLSHMIADGLGAAGIEAAIIDTLYIKKAGIAEQKISEAISEILKIEVSETDIKRGLRSLKEDGRIFQDQEKVLLSPDTTSKLNELISYNTSLENTALSQWYEDYISIYQEEESDKRKDSIINAQRSFICRFFLTHGADCYNFIAGQKVYDMAKTEAIAQETIEQLGIDNSAELQQFMSGTFAREFTKEQQSFLLLQFKKAVHYLSMVVNSDTLQHLYTSLNGLVLYLDTSILYRLFNLQGEQRFESMKSVVNHCQKAGITLKVLQVTVDELKRRIRYDARIIGKHPIPVSFAAIGYNARTSDNYISTFWNERQKTGISAEDFNFRYSDVIALLGQYNIQIDETDYILNKGLNQEVDHLRNIVADYGTFRDDQKSEKAVDHDAVCIATISSLQQKNSISAIESKVLFLSTDWSLIRLQRTHYDYKDKPDFAVLPSQLLQLFSMTTTTIDYYDAFIGLFSSSHISFGSGQLDNEEIQQIMGRVSAYSINPELAEHVLSNQLIQRKFSSQESEEEKNGVIDEAILVEIEAMEEKISLKNLQLKETERELGEKNRLLEKSNQDAKLALSERQKLLEELEKARSEITAITSKNSELENIVTDIRNKKIALKGRLFEGLQVIALIAIIGGLLLLLFVVMSFIPKTNSIVEPLWQAISPSFEQRSLSRGDCVNVLLGVGPLLMAGGFTLFKWSEKYIKEHIKRKHN